MPSQNSAICWKLRVSDATRPGGTVKMRSVRTISRKDLSNTSTFCVGSITLNPVRRMRSAGAGGVTVFASPRGRYHAYGLQRGASVDATAQESSETNTPSTLRGEDRVRPVRRRTELGRNDLAPDSSGVTTLVTLTVTPNVQDFNVWQSRQPVRRENLAQEIAISGKFAEWNAQTVPKVFGGGAVTTGTFAFPTDTASLDTFSTVVDVVDSTDKFRFVFDRVNQTEAVETQFNRSNIAVLPFNFAALAPTAGGSPGTIYTNAI